MRATLLYNPKAGGAASEEVLRDGLERIGWTVHRSLPKKEFELGRHANTDVVVVAGGDGTVASVAKSLVGTNLPMSVIPMGVANNIARSLGIGVDPLAAIGGLARAAERRVDLGLVSTASERGYFFEGFGIGAFAYVLAEKASRKTKKLKRAWTLIADELDAYAPQDVELDVDGQDRSGRYLLAAVMNARSLGPALGLAPQARYDDGELDVVLIPPEAKDALIRHLRRAAAEGDVPLPEFPTTRATKVRLRADGDWAHADDVSLALDGEVTIGVAPSAVRLLVPTHASTAPAPR